MKKNLKRILASFLSLSLLFGQSVPVLADQPEKEEVIYSVMDAYGHVNGLYAVNIFPGGEIVDHGEYSAVHMLNTEDPIAYEGGVIRIESDAERVYYQGNMDTGAMPWCFEITYELDGKVVPVEELAGKDGHVRITLDIRHNPDDKSTFFDSHALQITAQLDTEKCRNIVAQGATAANVGSVRQLTYMLLPGTERTYVIETDATDFEMNALAINGVKMDLEIDYDTDEVSDKTDELIDAAARFDDGADELMSGAWEAYNGGLTLRDGAKELHSGLETLTSHNAELLDGANQIVQAIMDTANETLDEARDDFKKLGIEVHELTVSNYQSEVDRLQAGILDGIEDYVFVEAEIKLQTAVIETVKENVEAAVRAAAEQQVTEGVTAAVRAQVEQQVRQQAEQSRPLVRAGVAEVVQQQVTESVTAAVRANVAAEVKNQVWWAFYNSILAAGRDAQTMTAEDPEQEQMTPEPMEIPDDDELTGNEERQADAGAESEAGAEAETETKEETEAGAEAEVEDEIEAGIDDEIEAEIEAEVETEMEAEIEAEIQAVIEAEINAEIEAQIEAQIEAEIEAEIQAELEKELEAEMQRQMEEEMEKEMFGLWGKIQSAFRTGTALAEEIDPALAALADDYVASAEGQALIAKETNAAMDTEAVKNQISMAVAQQMASGEVQALIDQNCDEQIEAIVASKTDEQMETYDVRYIIRQNVREQMASKEIKKKIEENIEAQMASDAVQKIIEENLSEQRKESEYLYGVADALRKNSKDGDAYETLGDLRDMLDDLMKFYDGLSDYLDGTSSAEDGAARIVDGATELAGTYNGNSSMGLGKLYDGTVALKDGTVEFRDRTRDIDEEITDEADRMIAERTGKDVEVFSFTSPENGRVKSVQFVISTPSVKKEKEEFLTQEEETEKNFREKLKELFKKEMR